MSVTIEVRRDGDRACSRCATRRRHRTGTSAPPYRALLPGRHRPQPRQRRHRPGPGHRQAYRRTAPGHARYPQRACRDGRGPPAVRLNSGRCHETVIKASQEALTSALVTAAEGGPQAPLQGVIAHEKASPRYLWRRWSRLRRQRPQQRGGSQIKIVGSSTVYPFTTAVAEDFQRANPGTSVIVELDRHGRGHQIVLLRRRRAIPRHGQCLAPDEGRRICRLRQGGCQAGDRGADRDRRPDLHRRH